MAQQRDLKRVGQWLRTRRTEQRLARTDLARRVGVTPTYLWMVEEARERANGEASQPSQFLLRQLATELGMTEQESHDLLRLAGYTPVDDAPADSTDPVTSGTSGSVDPAFQRALSRRRVLGLLDAVREELLGTHVMDEPVYPHFRTQLTVFVPESQLSEALQLMEEQRYSQVVVQEDGRLRLLSSEGIVRWHLAERTGNGSREIRTGELLALEPPDTMVVHRASSTIGEVMAAFVAQPSLVAVLVTTNGKDTEPPLGIITSWDLVEVIHEWTAGT